MKRKNIIVFICICLLLCCNCGTGLNLVKTNITEEYCQITAQDDILVRVDENRIRDFAHKFILVKKNDDSRLFKTWIDEKGIFSVTYFNDGRDRNSVIHVTKDILRDDLVLADAENKGGITLRAMFSGSNGNENSLIPIQTSHYLSEMDFPVNWSSTNVDTIIEKLDDIIKTCRDIIDINNEFEPQVFVLNNNIYVFTCSVKENPDNEIYGKRIIGDWVIFENINDKYFIRTVMKLQ